MSKKISYSESSTIQNALNTLLADNLKQRSESLKIGVIYKNHFYKFSYGKNYKYYDLASLTKVIFTVSAFMHYESKIKPVLDSPVVNILPWFTGPDSVKVKDLLAHQSGAPSLYPVYKKLKYDTLSGLEPLNLLTREITFSEKCPVYSDVGFFVLGAILESIYLKPLLSIYQHIEKTYDLGSIHFNPVGKKCRFPKNEYAPTEKCPLRKKMIQGEVHDENCWKMGGVGPHAGLFGSLEDVMMWLNNFSLNLESKDVKNTSLKFLQKQRGDWRLGLMVPSKPKSSSGLYFSDQAWGHLGFTGVSFWSDPYQALSVVILSNRTYPDRTNMTFNELRPMIHNTIWEALHDKKNFRP